jgi:hypothetical protein
MLNRKRFWFFTVVLALAFVLGAATLSAVFAGPPDRMAQDGLTEDRARRDGEFREPPPGRATDDPRQSPSGPPDGPPDQPGSGPASRVPAGPDRTPGPPGSAAGQAGAAAPPAPPYPTSGGRQQGRGGDAGPDHGGGPAGPGDHADPGEEPDGGDQGSEVYYANCNKAQRAGAAPLYRGQPGYRAKLDRDGDGVACD